MLLTALHLLILIIATFTALAATAEPQTTIPQMPSAKKIYNTYVMTDKHNFITIPPTISAIVTGENEHNATAIAKKLGSTSGEIVPLNTIEHYDMRDKAVWFAVRIASTEARSNNPIGLTITLNYFNHGRVDFYTMADHGSTHLLHSVGFDQITHATQPSSAQNKLATHHATLTDTNSSTVLVKITRPGPLTFSPVATVWKYDQYLNYHQTSSTLDALFIGLIFSSAVLGFLFYFIMKDIAYAWFGIICIATTLLCYFITGNGVALLWPDHPWINETIAKLSITFSAIFAILFSTHYLNLNQIFLSAHTILNALLTTSAAILIGIAITNFPIEACIIHALACVATLACLSFLCWRTGSSPALYFTGAWCTHSATLLLMALTLYGALADFNASKAGILCGLSVATLLLLTGLMEGFSLEKKREYAQTTKRHETTNKLKDAESQLVYRALHSRVTGLPNRTLLLSRLDSYFSSHSIERTGLTLVLIGIDNFQNINKTLGYENGDAILQSITHKLSHLLEVFPLQLTIDESNSSPSRHLAIIDGVIFATAFKTNDPLEIENITKELTQALEDPIDFQGISVDIHALIGYSSTNKNSKSSNELLQEAQIALQHSFQNKHVATQYSEAINPYSSSKIELISDLRNAIQNNELTLYFQPQINIDSKKLVGAEALIRWNHSKKGFVQPDEFIPIAERTGIIHSLTLWAIEKAITFYKELLSHNVDIELSVNISMQNLHHHDFSEKLKELFKQHDISTKKILLELTESTIVVNTEESTKTITQLANEGFGISIDDFGTGYASLSYLKQFPASQMKIDRSFITNIVTDSRDKQFVSAMINMGKHLDIEIVAEGIENEEMLQELQSVQCDIAQGYHIGKPMKETDFIAWIETYQA